MNLSKLVFLCVKNAIYYDDTSFSFDNFKRGLQNGNPDYATNINNVYLPLNEAIARLNDLDRIPYKIVNVNNLIEGVVNLTSIESENQIKIKEVINVVKKPDFIKLQHRNYGKNNILIISNNYKSANELLLEVKEDIPHFDSSYYYYRANDSLNDLDEHDTDLREYNIDDGMCNYIMEYVMGKLVEQISPELANMHITRAEQYFNNIQPNVNNFTQRNVEVKYGIE